MCIQKTTDQIKCEEGFAHHCAAAETQISPGEIIVLIIAALVSLILIGTGLYCFFYYKPKRDRRRQEQEAGTGTQVPAQVPREVPVSVVPVEVDPLQKPPLAPEDMPSQVPATPEEEQEPNAVPVSTFFCCV